MPGAIYQHAVGITLEVTLPTGLSLVGATFEAELRKPDGSVLLKTPTFVGLVGTYNTVKNDLDQPGQYQFKVTIVFAATGRRLPADPLVFQVWPNDRQGS